MTTREENADPAALFLFLHSHRFMYALRGCSGVNKNYVQHGGKRGGAGLRKGRGRQGGFLGCRSSSNS